MIQPVKVLHGHTSIETALVQHDYPYAGFRTDRRVWLEYNAKHGFRFGTQTLNPKTDTWNKPHYSTYHFWAILMMDSNEGPTKDHVHYMCTDYWGPDPAMHIHFMLSGAYAQMTSREQKEYQFLLRRNRERGNKTGWERWHETTRLMTENRSANGVFPTKDQLLKEHRHYLTEYQYEAAVAQIQTDFDPFE